VNFLSNETLKAFRLRSSKASVSASSSRQAGGSVVFEQKIAVLPLPSDADGRIKADLNFSLVAGDLLEVTAVYLIEIEFPTLLENTKGTVPAEEALEGIGLNSIVSIAWPYWRSHISRLLIEFGLPPINLPLFLPIDLTRQHLQSPSPGKSLAKKALPKKSR
jgi:hypothetical protein